MLSMESYVLVIDLFNAVLGSDNLDYIEDKLTEIYNIIKADIVGDD